MHNKPYHYIVQHFSIQIHIILKNAQQIGNILHIHHYFKVMTIYGSLFVSIRINTAQNCTR
jgi:hypothetical protein